MAILGIDEVGRGPWAGPLVVGAVVLCGGEIEGLTDSKKITAKKRERLAREIYESGAGIGLGWVGAEELDNLGLAGAMRLAVWRAVKEVRASYHEIVIDGTVNFLAKTKLERYVSVLPKADLLVPEVSAASIVAKVARDDYMRKLSEKYPEYGFEKHVGYGTAAHMAALREYGVTPEHRRSFRPVGEIAGDEPSPSGRRYARQPVFTGGGSCAPARNRGRADLSPTGAHHTTTHHSNPPTTKQIGDRAEEKVAEHLRREGHLILERNWKTKYSEIDIVSRKGEHIYFTEVKYRRDGERGDGLAAITAEKRQKMERAAESYMKYSGRDGSPILAVGAVGGEAYRMEDWFVIV